jgi:hypothetical protein
MKNMKFEYAVIGVICAVRIVVDDKYVFKLLSGLRVCLNARIAQYGHQQMFHMFQGMPYTGIVFCMFGTYRNNFPESG